jgi:hypothetical protein
MKINPFVYAGFVLVLFFGTILGFQTAGIWSISGKTTSSGDLVQPSAADVNTIKGWMTLEQITATFNVPLADLLNQFDLPADTPASTALKDLESDTFDTTGLRDWLQSRIQSDSSSQEITDSPAPAPAVGPLPTPTQPTSSEPILNEPATTTKTVTGKTTIQELLDWGMSRATLLDILGDNLPSPTTTVKDFVSAQGLEFSDVRARLQAEVERLQP